MDFRKVSTAGIFFRYVIPQMIGLVLNSVYFIVDGIFIGKRLGPGALAAAGAAVPVVEIMIALSMLVSVGAGISISHYFGAGENRRALELFNISAGGTLVLSFVIALTDSLFVVPLGRFLGASEIILNDTAVYLRYFLLFSPFLIFSFVLSTFARNDGRPVLAMTALAAGSASNIILDYVFMYPLNMGIAGAALATGLGPVFSVLILLPHFVFKKGRLFFCRVRFSLAEWGKSLALGLPAFAAEFSLGLITLLHNQALVRGGLGAPGLASYLVVGYAALIALTSFLGASQGMQPVVSFLAGAGEIRRIRVLFRTAAGFLVLLGIAFYAALFFFGKTFFGIFLDSSPELLAFTAEKSKIYFVNLPCAAINLLLIGFLQSLKANRPSLVISLSRSTLPVMLLLWLLPLILPENGIWLAMTGAEVFTMIPALVFWRARIAKGP